MAIEKIINIKVNDSDVDKLNSDLQSLDKNLSNVEGESKKASKGLKDVGDNGGAISVLDSLTGGLATRVRDAAEASKLFSFNLKGIRTALIATGIGAFVVALGLVVAYWDDIVGLITGANKELERQQKIQTEILLEQQRNLEVLDKQDNILKLQGKSQAEINKLKKDAINLVLEEQIESLRLAKIRLDELQELQKGGAKGLEGFFKTGFVLLENFGFFVDQVFSKLGFDTGFATFINEKSSSVLESVFGTQEDIDEAKNRVTELENAVLDSRNRLAGLELEDREQAKPEMDKQSTLDTLSAEDRQKIIDSRTQLFDELFELEQSQNEALAQLGQEGLNAAINDDNVLLEVKKKNAEDYLTYKKILNAQELQLTKQTLNNISNVLGQTSAAGKAVAVASALINTYQGITAELATKTVTPFEFGLKIANIATVTAIGFKSVKDILSTKLPNLGGAASSVSGGTGGASAPSFNVVGNSGVSQIAQTLNQEQQPVEAFVVAGNVSSAQELNRNIVSNATIG